MEQQTSYRELDERHFVFRRGGLHHVCSVSCLALDTCGSAVDARRGCAWRAWKGADGGFGGSFLVCLVVHASQSPGVLRTMYLYLLDPTENTYRECRPPSPREVGEESRTLHEFQKVWAGGFSHWHMPVSDLASSARFDLSASLGATPAYHDLV